jgi:hypothetical protein
MTRPITILLSLAFILITSGCGSPKHNFFSGKDLIGWSAYPFDKTSLWSVKNGVIFCQGLTTTYLRSDKEYSNYHFHCEWRWPENPGQCAVGLHTTGPDSFRPNSIEIQLKTPDAGDLYLAGPQLSASKMGLILRTDTHPTIRIPKELGDSENPTGQWNSLDVFCKANTIRVFINGFPQNELINVSRDQGSICMISRGVPIEFKNLYLNPLK